MSKDCVVSLSKTKRGYDAVLIVVDRLSKMAPFIPTSTTYQQRTPPNFSSTTCFDYMECLKVLSAIETQDSPVSSDAYSGTEHKVEHDFRPNGSYQERPQSRILTKSPKLNALNRNIEEATTALIKAQGRQKRNVDLKRKEEEFGHGKVTITKIHQTLHPKEQGIRRGLRIGLSRSLAIHPDFHVFLLKRHQTSELQAEVQQPPPFYVETPTQWNTKSKST
ncbi:hypothetical protein BZG36_04267 [Bifiguratus adelaidae]|uniref:Uncharacterized protein n=1 Tax=Bifiguratus adelaidae TaxID=1938954 RepID=A0A261XWU4_9FUNG|nr:hypothetical protein BZG36_04267 [Bifiguratus adelaidae]